MYEIRSIPSYYEKIVTSSVIISIKQRESLCLSLEIIRTAHSVQQLEIPINPSKCFMLQ